ncbi:MAG: hydrocarbon-binding protein [Nostoc sp. C3-bin3]|nr:hydrocarbon-binding protein [Nostoc sp. C3-bin3]
MLELKRDQLGQFSSTSSFRAVILGMADALGEKATAVSLIAAGRMHGKKLAAELELKGATQSLEEATKRIAQVLGAEGDRLCIIEKIVEEGDTIKVYTSETLCAVGGTEELPPMCTFTLGLVWGVLTELLNRKIKGTHTKSVLRGDSYDVFEFVPI